jgi:hypothetical protein
VPAALIEVIHLPTMNEEEVAVLLTLRDEPTEASVAAALVGNIKIL